MKIKLAMTGATGNMGRKSVEFLSQIEDVESITFLCKPNDKKRAKKLMKSYKKCNVIYGDLANYDDVLKLVANVDYVYHIGALIPPKSDQNVLDCEKSNFFGTKNIVDAIKTLEKQPKLIHISTVALYGNRNHIHPWARIGDPLLPSPYDPYAITKMEGERYVLDANLDCWAVIRQTAMLHSRMLTDNLSDGLMFHTCYNAPLEWATATDSGVLMANILKRDLKGEVNDFWKHVYNLGAQKENRITGFETFDDGFKMIGGSTEKFMEPQWNAYRNFHGVWFYDSHVLNDYFDYQHQSVSDYWKEILDTHKYYKLGKIVPAGLIKKFAIKRLLKNPNSPTNWINKNDIGRMTAYFGPTKEDVNISKDWSKFNLLCKGKLPDGTDINYDDFRNINNAKLLSHGYDDTKADKDITANDIESAVKFRGGSVELSDFVQGDLYKPLKFKCECGHEFVASAYTVVRAGHWCNKCISRYTWNYNKLAKNNEFYAQVWYDHTDKNENMLYSYDENYNAKYEEGK